MKGTVFTVHLKTIAFHTNGSREKGLLLHRCFAPPTPSTPLPKEKHVHPFIFAIVPLKSAVQCNAATAEPSIVLHVNLSMFVSDCTAEKILGEVRPERQKPNGKKKNIRLVLSEQMRVCQACMRLQSVCPFQRGQQTVYALSDSIFLPQIITWNKCSQETVF